MQPRQRSKCSTTVSVSSIVPSTRPLIRWIRPRGESISSCQSVYVGHDGRQKPQCTQSAISSRLHSASSDALGQRAPASSARVLAVGDTRSGSDERCTAAVPAAAAGQPRLQLAHVRPRLDALTAERGGLLGDRRGAPSNRTNIWSARMSTALGTSPDRCSSPHRSAPTATVVAAAGRGCSRNASCSTVPSLPPSRSRACRGRSRRRSSRPCRPSWRAGPSGSTTSRRSRGRASSRSGGAAARAGRAEALRRASGRRAGRARTAARGARARSGAPRVEAAPSTMHVRSPGSCSTIRAQKRSARPASSSGCTR